MNQILLFAGQSLLKNIRWVLLAGALLGLFYALKPFWLKIFGLVPADMPFKIGGGDVTKQFYANSKTKVEQVRKGIRDDAWFGSELRCNIFQELTTYNDNELILIHNLYKNKYGITLYSDLNNITGDGCANLFSVELNVKIKENLSKLGIV
jgi:hypothetical protein